MLAFQQIAFDPRHNMSIAFANLKHTHIICCVPYADNLLYIKQHTARFFSSSNSLFFLLLNGHWKQYPCCLQHIVAML